MDRVTHLAIAYSLLNEFFHERWHLQNLVEQRETSKIFPTELEESIKEYYEYVSKRASDNNMMIDNLC